MNKQVMAQILDKIRAYDRILIFRHIRMDGDCVGASKGLRELIRHTWPEKEVLIIDDQHSDYLAFMGEDDAPIPDEQYRAALGIVVDTGSADRISNQKYTLCREVIKIDHHIERDPYGVICWVEDWRSSACEMIAAFYAEFRDVLKISKDAATYIYTGMVTDSGRFEYEGVNGDTLRLAGLMLDQGVDTQTLYAQMYLRDFSALKFRAYIYEHMQMTENGVAYIVVDKAMQERFGLTIESASTAISALEGIRGCLCWMAFIEIGDEQGTIRVRLRSRFAAINTVAEQFRGGGHACASGATVYGQEEISALLAVADTTIKTYKETHEGWL